MSDGPQASVRMRQAAKADLPGVLALYAQPGMDDEVLSIADAEAIFERMCAYPDYTLFVAEQEGQIVGTLALLIMDNLGHMGAKSAVVEDVVVDRNLQGHGIGKIMMRHAMQRAAAKHCYKMTLSSNAKRTLAHAFYDGLGFRRHGFSFWVDIVPVDGEAAP
ncbi:MAG: GNAT family N-acetyltransferase [Proteobacteria bacterium]|nr:GNAT family N-acetyltransferase [Pseudomonadota bacterium]